MRAEATEGAADVFTDVWSTCVHLLYVDPSPGIMTPTFGLAFRWGGPTIGNNGATNMSIERKYDDDRKVKWLRAGYYQDEKVVASELGYTIFTGITA